MLTPDTVEMFRGCLGIFASEDDRTAQKFTPLCDLYEPAPDAEQKYIPNYGEYHTAYVPAFMNLPNGNPASPVKDVPGDGGWVERSRNHFHRHPNDVPALSMGSVDDAVAVAHAIAHELGTNLTKTGALKLATIVATYANYRTKRALAERDAEIERLMDYKDAVDALLNAFQAERVTHVDGTTSGVKMWVPSNSAPLVRLKELASTKQNESSDA